MAEKYLYQLNSTGCSNYVCDGRDSDALAIAQMLCGDIELVIVMYACQWQL